MLQSQPGSPDDISKLGLQFRIYDPRTDKTRPTPAVFLVHGRAGNDQVMWVFSKALQSLKSVVIAPQAFEADEKNSWSWWSLMGIDMTQPRRTTWENLHPAIERLEQFIKKSVEHFCLDASHLAAAGFSQGGAVLAGLSLKEPELFQGVAVLSSFIPAVIYEAPEKLPVRGAAKKYFLYHGTRDPIVPFDRSEKARDFFLAQGAAVELFSEEVTHKVGSQGMKALGNWFEQLK